MFLKNRREVKNMGDLESRAEFEEAKKLWISQFTSEL